jgi:hypothetical protein
MPNLTTGCIFKANQFLTPIGAVSPPVATLWDESSRKNHGTNTSVTYTQLKSGLQVPTFNGTTSKSTCGSDFIKTQALTIMGWIYAIGWGGGDVGNILTNAALLLRGSITNSVLDFSSDNGGTRAYSANNSLLLNNHYHIAITRTAAGTTNFYIKGILSGAANQASGAPIVGGTNVIIGNRNGSDRAFNGYISQLKIYSGILTLGNIKNDYDSSRYKYGVY